MSLGVTVEDDEKWLGQWQWLYKKLNKEYRSCFHIFICTNTHNSVTSKIVICDCEIQNCVMWHPKLWHSKLTSDCGTQNCCIQNCDMWLWHPKLWHSKLRHVTVVHKSVTLKIVTCDCDTLKRRSVPPCRVTRNRTSKLVTEQACSHDALKVATIKMLVAPLKLWHKKESDWNVS